MESIGSETIPYFAKPVVVRDGDVVGAVVSAAPVPVQNGSQVREVAVEINVLAVGPTVGPTVQQVTLKGRHWNEPKTPIRSAEISGSQRL